MQQKILLQLESYARWLEQRGLLDAKYNLGLKASSSPLKIDLNQGTGPFPQVLSQAVYKTGGIKFIALLLDDQLPQKSQNIEKTPQEEMLERLIKASGIAPMFWGVSANMAQVLREHHLFLTAEDLRTSLLAENIKEDLYIFCFGEKSANWLGNTLKFASLIPMHQVLNWSIGQGVLKIVATHSLTDLCQKPELKKPLWTCLQGVIKENRHENFSGISR